MRGFAANRNGATAIEYGLIAGLIALVLVSALTSIGGNINGIMLSVAAAVH